MVNVSDGNSIKTFALHRCCTRHGAGIVHKAVHGGIKNTSALFADAKRTSNPTAEAFLSNGETVEVVGFATGTVINAD